jgi:gas vesicle protein
MRNSNKVPYVIAGSVIGGAAAYLLLTDSGRRFRSEIRGMNADTIPQKMENLRGALERRTQDLSRKVESIRSKINESVDAGRRTFNESSENVRTKLARIESKNTSVTTGIHKSLDELGRTIYSLERSVLDPLYQVVGLAQALKTGVRTLKPAREVEEDRTTPMFDRERMNTGY